MKIQFAHNYDGIISIENLLKAWKEFINGKKSRRDVQEFQLNLMGNIFSLHNDLFAKTYKHSAYTPFNISDPKPRKIHKASVRDRLLHRAIYRMLYPLFDRIFISDSYSCRLKRGTHKSINRFRSFAYKVSKNHTRTAWILKCDIKKFFDNIDHKILLAILGRRYTNDQDILWLLARVINSFSSSQQGIGLPLGNLTSQLFVNIYMNEFDQFIKHKLKARYYIRYADDFVILFEDKKWLKKMLPKISEFLQSKLGLKLHADKVSIKTLASGIDFLGWVHFPDHRSVRTTTRKRMLRGVKRIGYKDESIQSYLGLLSHGNSRGLRQKIEEEVYINSG
ncbi:MAG: group II intron reverse transcriptase domain-containing protein [Candidatus Yanofskybacteria bacterium]|nr:group II intron reverse transcriptase domain-containing protein [Candidatus Yanofskybacteria bacterium]